MDTINATQNATQNATAVELTFEGSCVASAALFIMAVLPILVGSIRSKEKKEEEDIEIVSSHDAAMFPVVASCALFGIFMVFKYVPINYVNFLLNIHFSIFGTLSMGRLFGPMFRWCVPKRIKFQKFEFDFKRSVQTDKPEEDKWEILDKVSYKFSNRDLVGYGLAAIIGVWYLLTRHWIANNFVGITLAVLAIELIRLDKFMNGFFLLGGLFFYDIFWVFGTKVMVSVAKNLEAPIKVTFPRDFLVNGVFGKQLALLGLGDIVIPGIFVALLLRFDRSLNRQGKQCYFHTGLAAYIIGLLVTFLVMHTFNAAQPALLYLVPACLGGPLLLAFMQGDLEAMFNYRDVPEKEKANEKQSKDQISTSTNVKKDN